MDSRYADPVSLPGQQHWPETFPLVYQVTDGADDPARLADWIARQRSVLLEELARHGALLIRGAPLPDALAFDRFIQGFGLDNFAYRNSLSNAVRQNLTERVFTANEAPAEVAIYLHHEMAQTPYYPSRLFFYCEQAAGAGGATPLCRSDILCQRLEEVVPEFLDSCRRLGVRYTNVMPADNDAASGQGRSWRSTLRVESRGEAEEKLTALGYRWQWLPADTLQVTTRVMPAVRRLEDGREVFFNQLIAAHRGWQDTRNEASRSIRYGDDSRIEAAHLDTLVAQSDALTFDLPWQSGDVALVDNFLVMHGRRPFQGRRRVLASLVA